MTMIPTAGIHNLSDRDYFAIPLPSSSATKTLLTGTNAHLAHEIENPQEDTEAFALGAYLHALVLRPQSIEDDFIVAPKLDRRTKEGKAEYESIQRRAELSGARIVTTDMVAQAVQMAASIKAHKSASFLFSHAGWREATVVGTIAGNLAKAKIDGVFTVENGPDSEATIIVDVKTAASASPREFSKAAAQFGYFHQAAFYSRLAAQHFGAIDGFVFVVVEKTPPYLCAVYRVPEAALIQADSRIDALVARWWAVNQGDRTGYPSQIIDLEPPSWWLTDA